MHKKLVKECENPKSPESSAEPRNTHAQTRTPKAAHKVLKRFESIFLAHVKAATECHAKLSKAEAELERMRGANGNNSSRAKKEFENVAADRSMLRKEAQVLHKQYNDAQRDYREATQTIVERDATIELMEARIQQLLRRIPEKVRVQAAKRKRSSHSMSANKRQLL